MKKFILFCIVFLFSICLFAQSKTTKSTIEKIIRDSKVELHDGKFTLPSNKAWVFNNADSLYFKQDTLTAFLYKSSKHKSLCELIDWTFYRKKSFILGNEFNCKEPPTRKVEKYPKDYFTIAVYTVENETIIDVLRYDKMIVESFIILNIEENPECTKIKLIRRLKV